MPNGATADSEIAPLSEESPMDWLARIVPDEWDATEEGYQLLLQSDGRRVIVDPLRSKQSGKNVSKPRKKSMIGGSNAKLLRGGGLFRPLSGYSSGEQIPHPGEESDD